MMTYLMAKIITDPIHF